MPGDGASIGDRVAVLDQNYPVEVEAVLADHAAVAVIGLPNEKWGEAVHAVVVRSADRQCDPAELRARARERLAGYKVPKTVDFLDSLPTGPTGKVVTRELRASYAGESG